MERVLCEFKLKLFDDGENIGHDYEIQTNISYFYDWIIVFSHIAATFKLNEATAELAKMGIDFYLNNKEVFNK